ncbi:MAG: hypothetical protein PUP92_34720 [Rhizonema sp. PD38]|nr:hypothetical protein [Rhizonema sp. PD38]
MHIFYTTAALRLTLSGLKPRRFLRHYCPNIQQLLAVEKDKTMTQIVEELIDTLPEPKALSVTQP